MEAGQRIRNYVLREKIGEGGMGEVWSALHEVLQRPVAIKAMATHLSTDPGLKQRFLREARAQALLQHPRILGVTDAFEEGGMDFLVMPLVVGHSLADRIAEARGPLPVAEALHIAADVLDALEAAHQRGIIHRDVKPSNILLDQEGRAYLTDFGIALLAGQDRQTRTGIALGTPYYMSPEQIQSPLTIDQRCDVYSASCVIYEMLAGRPPFIGKEGKGVNTSFVVLEAHLRHLPEPVRTWNPAVPAAVDAALLRGLAKDPGQRYAGCGELRRALEAAGAVAPPPPPPPAFSTRPVPPSVPPPVPPPLPTPAARIPPPVPLASRMPPPQMAAAPRRSRGGFFLGIACGVVLALLGLASLGNWLSKSKADAPATEEPAAGTVTTAPETPGTVPATAPAEGELRGKFVKVWVEHNIQQEGRTGMVIHTHFVVEGAREDACQLTAYFHYATGEVLKDFDKDYRTDDGQVSVWGDFTPQFDSTEFEDFTLFMPYDELHMAPGNHELKFNLQVHHQPSKTVVVESDYVPFTLNQA